MTTLGLDIGSRTIKLVACENGEIVLTRKALTSHDPLAVADATLKIPCSCMTPNGGRLAALDVLIMRFKPDVIIDVVLHACRAYNVESYKIIKHVGEKHGLPSLKIETDYANGDVEQIRTRVEALFDSL